VRSKLAREGWYRARRASKIAAKVAVEEKALRDAETNPMASEKSVETTTIITAIEETTSSVVVVEEHASIRMATSIPPEDDRRNGTAESSTST
jgi:hypothetical protein